MDAKNYSLAADRISLFVKNGSSRTPNSVLFSQDKFNQTEMFNEEEYLFDRTDVRAVFIILYSIVFGCCFFGNVLVIMVVILSRRLRSITNFFLANLAVADLSVGVFCVYQNLSLYLIESWMFGDFLCKMYWFIHSLSYTASIFILVVICTERYFAIVYPIHCKQMITCTRVRLVIIGVWISSAIYSVPKFIWVQTINMKVTTLKSNATATETICVLHRKEKELMLQIFDVINFCLLYALPLFIMTVLYTKIALGLCRSSKTLDSQSDAANSTLTSTRSKMLLTTSRQSSIRKLNATVRGASSKSQSSSENVLRARRKVIRMLIVVVFTFAVCNLPYHARKMWQHWSSDYRGNSHLSSILTPVTFLFTYVNSGINPLLYAFLSNNFRKGIGELLLCSIDKNGPASRLFNRRKPASRSSVLRISTSTKIATATTTTPNLQDIDLCASSRGSP